MKGSCRFHCAPQSLTALQDCWQVDSGGETAAPLTFCYLRVLSIVCPQGILTKVAEGRQRLWDGCLVLYVTSLWSCPIPTRAWCLLRK